MLASVSAKGEQCIEHEGLQSPTLTNVRQPPQTFSLGEVRGDRGGLRIGNPVSDPRQARERVTCIGVE